MPTSHGRSTSTTNSRAASRADSSARTQIIDSLKDDHKRAKKAFRQFEKLDAQKDADECRAIVQQTCAELKVHSALEEELLYPNARELLKQPDLVDEAEVEHATAKQLIEQLEAMSPDDAKYGATFTVLGEYVNHHIKEEEGEMFPQLERAKGADWQGLCDEMAGRREELMEQFEPQEAGAADGGSAPRSGASSSRGTSPAMRRARSGAEQRAQASDESRDTDRGDDEI